MKPQNCDGKSAPKKHRGLREPWKPGESGNPAGRPKGSRNKLGEEFITEIYNDCCEHGAAALKKVRENRPEVYVKVVASLLPREIEARVSGETLGGSVRPSCRERSGGSFGPS